MKKIVMPRMMKHRVNIIFTTVIALAVLLLVINSSFYQLGEFSLHNTQRDGSVSKEPLSIREKNVANEIGTPYRVKHFRSAEEYCDTQKQAVTPDMLKHIIVNDKHKILYCLIPKVACTNWSRIMLILTGQMNTSDPMELKAHAVHNELSHHLTYLSSYSMADINLRLDTYYKFMFTRNPFERILSAYRNKFTRKNPVFHKGYGREIVKRHRPKQSRGVISGSDVTFYEFVQYLTDFTRKDALNPHWDKMTSLCHPCHVKYDLVSSYEDLERNSDAILERIGVSEKLKFPKRAMSYKHAETDTLLRKYYSNIPPVLLDQFMELYYSDFLMFNCKIPASLRDLTRWRVKF